MDNVGSFWEWFLQHEEDLFDFERDREAIFDQLADELQRVHPDLTFEFGPVENGRRDFVVSASGIREAFPAVQALVAAAPALNRWNVIAFRPRRPQGNIIEFGGYRVDPKEVRYQLVVDGNQLGLRLFIRGYTDGNVALKQIGYLLLDEALGEYDVETKLGVIEMVGLESEADGDCSPVADLAAEFDRAGARLS
jgi:hypothetical protein